MSQKDYDFERESGEPPGGYPVPPSTEPTHERQAGLRDEAVFMSDVTLWADVRKFIRWSANVRDDTAEAIAVARSLNERIDAADGEASERIRAALAVAQVPAPALHERWCDPATAATDVHVQRAAVPAPPPHDHEWPVCCHEA